MPAEVSEEDFHPFTCGLSKFTRRTTSPSPSSLKSIPDWQHGNGVGGGWDCVLNGDCSFLSGGEERGWHFSGEEDFDTGPVDGKGLGAGLGIGGNGGELGSKL
jgi:transcription factor C subunit 7